MVITVSRAVRSARPRLERRQLFRAPAGRREFEAFEHEVGRNGATNKCPFPEALGGLPGMDRNDGLRLLAGGQVRTEANRRRWAPRHGDGEFERRTGIPVPYLDSIDAMPTRALAARKQKINRGRVRSPVALPLITKRLAVMRLRDAAAAATGG
jgi:hypothetical protein